MNPRLEKISINRKTPISNRELRRNNGAINAQSKDIPYIRSSMKKIVSIWLIRVPVTGTCILSIMRQGRVIFTSRLERLVTPLRVITPVRNAINPVAIRMNRVSILIIIGNRSI